jgi:tRNA pseudouridine13 synthase
MEYSIKVEPEDFQVEEIPENIPIKADGKYTILKIRLKNWETNHFITYLARYLGISRKRITYGGTKDKRALTTQYFCLNASRIPENINIGDCEIIERFKTDRILDLGDLKGNKFRIRVSCPEMTSYDVAERRILSTNEGGAFWNEFGIQRFGNRRYNTHIVGRKLIKEGLECAVKEYLYDPEIDKEDFRVNLGKDWNFSKGIYEFPEYLQFERALMSEIIAGKSYGDVFDSLPRSLRIMFIHAYQSFLFNKILNLRKNIVKSPLEVISGDFVSPIDDLYNIYDNQIIEVTDFNIQKINEMSSKHQVVVLAPLIGLETREQVGVPGEIIKKVMDAEMLTKEDFQIKEKGELSSTGNYRGIGFLPHNFSRVEKDVFEFTLGRGIYATTLMEQMFA